MKPVVEFENWGLVRYQEAWDKQEEIFAQIIAQKMHNRNHPEEPIVPRNYLFYVTHPHVYTLGKSGSMDNLLLSESELKLRGIDFHKINRGGDITYHGPGQIVGYPLLDMEQFFTDIHKFLRYLEEAIILTLADYGIKAGRIKGLTGVWIDEDNPEKARKICAMGVRCSRWVTMHGFAFNVNTDLDYFRNIIPCGIDDKDVTSMKRELGRELDMEEVGAKLRKNLADLFIWQEQPLSVNAH